MNTSLIDRQVDDPLVRMTGVDIARIADDMGLDEGELGWLLGVDRTTVHRWIRGHARLVEHSIAGRLLWTLSFLSIGKLERVGSIVADHHKRTASGLLALRDVLDFVFPAQNSRTTEQNIRASIQ